LRLFDPAAALVAGGFDPLLAGWWLAGFEWMTAPGIGIADLPVAAPGVRPLVALGAEASWALLACELLLVGGVLCAMVDRSLAAPLCSGCRRWCRREPGLARLAAPAWIEPVTARAHARDWHFFRQLGAARGGRALRLDLTRCPGCDRTAALSIALTRPFRSRRLLLADLRLGPDDLRTVKSLASPPVADSLRSAPPSSVVC
jgi:hypothetical protein